MSFKYKAIFILSLTYLLQSGLLQAQNQVQTDTLTVGYALSPPFVVMENEKLNGISTWLWKKISEENQINYKLKEMSLDSLPISLQAGGIDVCLNPLTITSARSRNANFSAPYYISNSTILTVSLSQYKKLLLFLGSFISPTFLRAAGMLLLLIFVFGFVTWLFERKKNKEQFGAGLKGIGNGMWWSAVTMTTVGYGDKAPITPGGRVVAFIWMFAAILLISGITASIASSLTVNSLSWSQSTVSSFKDSQLGTVSESSSEEWLKRKFFKDVRTYSDINECLKALNNKKIEAIVYDEPILKSVAENDSLERYDLLSLRFNLQMYAIGFSKQTSRELQDRVSTNLLEITESHDWQAVLQEYNLMKTQ